MRDEVIDYVGYWTGRTEVPAGRLVAWLGIGRSKYHEWKCRYGKVNEHNARVPRDHWLEAREKRAIAAYAREHPGQGYRRLTYMMMDADSVAASPASVYRVLKDAGLMESWNRKPSKKGTGFEQPLKPHEHWHVDLSYINVRGTFYYLCSVLDGYSRYIVHWEIREAMKERDVEIILQRGREAFPGVQPRIISDNGPQFIAKEFKAFIRICGMTHVRTSPYYPQSNGKIERWHKSLKKECIRPASPLSLDDARRSVAGFVAHYNGQRLHGAVGYVTPQAKLEGRAETIHAERDRKLAAAREARRCRRRAGRMSCAAQQSERRPCVSQQSARMSYASELRSNQTGGLESPWSSVASASPHPRLGGVEATGRKGRPPAVPEPRPSPPAGGLHEHQEPDPARGAELLNTKGGLSNSR
jgi:transposase InsO family protein